MDERIRNSAGTAAKQGKQQQANNSANNFHEQLSRATARHQPAACSDNATAHTARPLHSLIICLDTQLSLPRRSNRDSDRNLRSVLETTNTRNLDAILWSIGYRRRKNFFGSHDAPDACQGSDSRQTDRSRRYRCDVCEEGQKQQLFLLDG
jgi:hypothetical protein